MVLGAEGAGGGLFGAVEPVWAGVGAVRWGGSTLGRGLRHAGESQGPRSASSVWVPSIHSWTQSSVSDPAEPGFPGDVGW